MAENFTIPVNTNLESAIASLETTMKELQGTMDELLIVLKQTRDGTGFVTGTDLSEQEVG